MNRRQRLALVVACPIVFAIGLWSMMLLEYVIFKMQAPSNHMQKPIVVHVVHHGSITEYEHRLPSATEGDE
jgi:hypothetical protein